MKRSLLLQSLMRFQKKHWHVSFTPICQKEKRVIASTTDGREETLNLN